MSLRERMAMKAAEKLIKKVDKKDFLRQLKEAIEQQGMLGQEGAVEAAIERIENFEGGRYKKLFDQLGITREDIEEAFKNEPSREETTHEGEGRLEQKEDSQNENQHGNEDRGAAGDTGQPS